MSRCVDLFISSPEPLDALARLIAGRAGLSATPDPSSPAGAGQDSYQLAAGDLVAVLSRHRYVDDDDLPLSRYEYALSMRTVAPGHLGSSLEVGLLRRVAAELDDRAVLLVLDLQNRASPAPPGAGSDGESPPAAGPQGQGGCVGGSSPTGSGQRVPASGDAGAAAPAGEPGETAS